MGVTTEIQIVVGEGEAARTLTYWRRDAWMVRTMLDAGVRGVSSLEQPGRRLSHYVLRLRRSGLPVETVPVEHAGAFAGRHGRYRLATPVRVVEEVRS